MSNLKNILLDIVLALKGKAIVTNVKVYGDKALNITIKESFINIVTDSASEKIKKELKKIKKIKKIEIYAKSIFSDKKTIISFSNSSAFIKHAPETIEIDIRRYFSSKKIKVK